ncbi:cell division protein ZapE [Deinococcus sp.]|uniref:cell division protein ZapE n=1 Tax=Deinococcus sp. TaxID=47478 RepID=UPI003CC5FD70
MDLSARLSGLGPLTLGDPAALAAGLTPGARFREVRFESYRPNPAFPSQAAARQQTQGFVASLTSAPSAGGLVSRWFGPARLGRRPLRPEGRGLYLDGGFGVGKTHLLASAYHAARLAGVPSAFMSFQDLMYLIGALGMTRATQALSGLTLLCLDEFELDDPGNTHLANTFLAELMPGGLNVIATSNTEPGALGQGRFNAQDFGRQIQAIAGRFQNLQIDGPDYRQRGSLPEAPLNEAEYARWRARQDAATLAELDAEQLQMLLLSVHPARFGALLEGIAAMGCQQALQPMVSQNAALRWVHFIDKVYDLGLRAAFSGAPLGTLFDDSYRHGAYAKKYARCLSRLSELLREARQAL